MIDVADNNAAYYYHFDGLGSVVALSDSAGDTVQTYEYSVYGQVAASEPEFLTNPYMFIGRRFDIETGLYYYRARYYNPHIGRFMQTDPIGCGDGINWYLYCGNNPLAFVDPSGTLSSGHQDIGRITYILADPDEEKQYLVVADVEEFIEWLEELRDANDRIVFFEFVGHSVSFPESPTDAEGLLMGNDVFGLARNFGDDPKNGIADTYSIFDYRELLQAVFSDPCGVTIELEACYSAGTIGKAFKSILPDAEVWGYTGICEPYWPFYYWETTGWGWGEVEL